MATRTVTRMTKSATVGKPKRISYRQSLKHTDEAYAYFARIRPRLFKNAAYRGKFVAIRDRQLVDVDADKLILYERLLQHFPDHRFAVSQVLHEIPTASIESLAR